MSSNATMNYPGTRIRSNGKCEKCSKSPGDMVVSGRLKFEDASGKQVELLKWTCDKCGYTMLFDLDVARNQPCESNDYREIIPD